MAENGTRFQSWNKRSKFWVLYEKGKKGFIDRSREKFPGVPVKTGKPSTDEKEVKKDSEPGGAKAEKVENKSESGGGLFGFFGL